MDDESRTIQREQQMTQRDERTEYRKPRTTQQKRSLAKKTHILEVATDLFRHEGYEGATIRDICAAAGVTTGTFYNFFGDKRGLIRFFLIQVQERNNPSLQTTPDHLAHPFQTILDFFATSSAFMEDLPRDLAKEYVIESTSLMTGAYDVAPSDTIATHMTRFLEAAQAAGTVTSETSARDIADYLLSASMGFSTYWIMRASSMSYEEAFRKLLIPAFAAYSTEELEPHFDV